MKISGTQLVWIIVTTQVIVTMGLMISPTIAISQQDAWISMLVGGGIGVALTYIVVRLSVLHPGQTLAQFSQTLLGKWLARIIVFPYLIAWYSLTAAILRSFADFLHLVLVDRTPIWIIVVLLASLISYMTYSAGITGIGRYCEMVGPLIILVLIGTFILNVGNVDWHYLLPVYVDSGWLNILKGSLDPAFWFSGPFVLLVIVAFMQSPQKALRKSMLGVAITVSMVFTGTLMVISVFGPNLSSKLKSSYFLYVRTIDILNFIQNLDVLVMFIWIFGVFAELSLYLFIASYETARFLGVKDWRKVVWFSVLTVSVIAVLIPNESVIKSFLKLWSSWVYPIYGIGIPVMLWIITIIKKHLFNVKSHVPSR